MELNRRYLLRLYLEQKNIIRVLKQWNFLFLTSPYSVSLTLAMPGLAYKSQYTVMRISFFLSGLISHFLTTMFWSKSYKTIFLAPADFTGVFFNHEKFQKSICLRRILWNEIGMGKGTSMSHYRFCDKVVLIRFYVIQILSGLKSFSLLSLHIYTVNDYRQKLCFLFLPAFAYKPCSSSLLWRFTG